MSADRADGSGAVALEGDYDFTDDDTETSGAPRPQQDPEPDPEDDPLDLDIPDDAFPKADETEAENAQEDADAAVCMDGDEENHSAPPAEHPDEDDDDDSKSAIIWEINRSLDDGVELTKYQGYTAPQLRQIRLALAEGCAEILTKGKFNYLQMELIRKGHKEKLETNKYAKPCFDVNQMWEIMEGLRAGVDTDVYADPKFTAQQMEQLRLGLMAGVDAELFADPELTPQQMFYRRDKTKPAPFRSRFKRAMVMLKGGTNGKKPSLHY